MTKGQTHRNSEGTGHQFVRQAVAKPPKMNQVIDAFQMRACALHRRGVTGIHDVRLMADKDGARAFQNLPETRRKAAWPAIMGHPTG
jgi:hypothetical protein